MSGHRRLPSEGAICVGCGIPAIRRLCDRLRPMLEQQADEERRAALRRQWGSVSP